MKDLSLPMDVLLPAPAGKGAPLALRGMGLMRRTWFRRLFLALLLALGMSFTLLQACPGEGSPTEPQAQVLCLDECDFLPAALVVHADPEGCPGEVRPLGALMRLPRQRNLEPEVTPPRD